MEYIISYNSQSKNLCFLELKKLNCNFKEIDSLSNEQSLINLDIDNEKLIKIINTKPIIFLRHIIKITKKFNKNYNKTDFFNTILNNLSKNLTFSIQFLSNINKQDCSINIQTLADELEKNNYILNVKQPEPIISIYETQNTIMLGFGNENLNLSTFKGGAPHFSKKQEFVSRAEYKLLEATNLTNLELSKISSAADLGAAPGGWTKVLASKNINVHSIDPAHLSPEIKNIKNVKHFQMLTEEFLQKFNFTYDLIVNDMKMDISLSTDIILSFYPRLNTNGYVIMTFKLAKNFTYSQIINQLKRLTEKYKLVLARQLFHNRSEITVVLKKL